MGRPRDEFAWAQVEATKGGWICKFCKKDFKGSASRIRNHLSGKKTDISACPAVPKEIRKEALKVIRKKGGTLQSSSSSIPTPLLQVPSSSSAPAVAPPVQQVASPNMDVNNVAAVAREEAATERMDMDDDAVGMGSNNHLMNTTSGAVWEMSYLNATGGNNVAEGSLGMNNVQLPPSTFGSFHSESWNTIGGGVAAPSSNHLINSARSGAAREEAVTERILMDKDVNDALAEGVSSAFITRGTREEYVAAFIKLLMCNSSPSAISDVLKYPYVREFLEREDVGAPSSLIQGDPKFVIEKPLVNIKHEVYQYMLMAQESWKTTGCTAIMFNLNRENKGKSFYFDKDRYVCGFYCPKGFIFVDVPNPDIDRKGFLDSLEPHSPSLEKEDENFGILHPESDEDDDLEDLENDYSCEFSDDGKKPRAPLLTVLRDKCLRQKIQRTCIKVCSSSKWAQGLINKAIKIQKLIQSDADLVCCCDRLLREKGKRLKHKGNLNAKGASGLSNFLSIMLLEDTIKEKLSWKIRLRPLVSDEGDDVEAILDDFSFWGYGRKLEGLVNLILRIPDLMDTLIPTAGYVAMAVNTVEECCKRTHPYINDEHRFWKELVLELRLSVKVGLMNWRVLGYLNPLYYLQQIRKDPELQCKVVQEVQEEKYYPYFYEEDTEKLKGELTSYHDVCSNLPREINLHNYHPVKFWEKYGGELPTLQKLAIKVLSRPVTCMCNQVKKHLYELQGADDVALRLNLRMMEQFKLLGDDIYKPLDLSELMHCWSS